MKFICQCFSKCHVAWSACEPLLLKSDMHPLTLLLVQGVGLGTSAFNEFASSPPQMNGFEQYHGVSAQSSADFARQPTNGHSPPAASSSWSAMPGSDLHFCHSMHPLLCSADWICPPPTHRQIRQLLSAELDQRIWNSAVCVEHMLLIKETQFWAQNTTGLQGQFCGRIRRGAPTQRGAAAAAEERPSTAAAEGV